MVTLTLPSNRGLPFMGRTNTPRRRQQPVHYNKRSYRMGHKIETLFPRLKDRRPVATRYDCCAHVFCSAIRLAAIVLFS